MWWLLILIFYCVVSWCWQKYSDKKKCLPPGPFRFPGIGCILQILYEDSLPYKAFQKLSKKYGNVIYVQMGIVKGVVINGYYAIMEVCHNDDWLGMMDEKFIVDRTFGKPIGLIFGRRDVWKETRRFCARNLRDFGFGVKSTMESYIQVELEEFCAHLSDRIRNSNGVISGFPLFHFPVINAVWCMVMGSRFDYEDHILHKLFELNDDVAKAGSFGAGLMSAYPFLSEWTPRLVGFDKMQKGFSAGRAFLKNIVEDTRRRGEYQTNPTNFIEVFLQKIDSREKDGTLDDIIYDDENLVSILFDFFLAGSETASNTLSFGLLFMILNPEIQEKVRAEIDATVGSRRALYTEKDKMPYTEATILEIFRVTNIAPIVPRKLDMNATVGKYKLPKGTTVFINLYSASMDKEFWGDPEVFRPERFLSPEGKVVNAEKILPFSAGKRNCIGDSLAKTLFFMFFTGLLQQFTFATTPAEPKPSTDAVPGFSLSPKPFSMIVTPRH